MLSMSSIAVSDDAQQKIKAAFDFIKKELRHHFEEMQSHDDETLERFITSVVNNIPVNGNAMPSEAEKFVIDELNLFAGVSPSPSPSPTPSSSPEIQFAEAQTSIEPPFMIIKTAPEAIEALYQLSDFVLPSRSDLAESFAEAANLVKPSTTQATQFESSPLPNFTPTHDALLLQQYNDFSHIFLNKTPLANTASNAQFIQSVLKQATHTLYNQLEKNHGLHLVIEAGKTQKTISTDSDSLPYNALRSLFGYKPLAVGFENETRAHTELAAITDLLYQKKPTPHLLKTLSKLAEHKNTRLDQYSETDKTALTLLEEYFKTAEKKLIFASIQRFLTEPLLIQQQIEENRLSADEKEILRLFKATLYKNLSPIETYNKLLFIWYGKVEPLADTDENSIFAKDALQKVIEETSSELAIPQQEISNALQIIIANSASTSSNINTTLYKHFAQTLPTELHLYNQILAFLDYPLVPNSVSNLEKIKFAFALIKQDANLSDLEENELTTFAELSPTTLVTLTTAILGNPNKASSYLPFSTANHSTVAQEKRLFSREIVAICQDSSSNTTLIEKVKLLRKISELLCLRQNAYQKMIEQEQEATSIARSSEESDFSSNTLDYSQIDKAHAASLFTYLDNDLGIETLAIEIIKGIYEYGYALYFDGDNIPKSKADGKAEAVSLSPAPEHVVASPIQLTVSTLAESSPSSPQARNPFTLLADAFQKSEAAAATLRAEAKREAEIKRDRQIQQEKLAKQQLAEEVLQQQALIRSAEQALKKSQELALITQKNAARVRKQQVKKSLLTGMMEYAKVMRAQQLDKLTTSFIACLQQNDLGSNDFLTSSSSNNDSLSSELAESTPTTSATLHNLERLSDAKMLREHMFEYAFAFFKESNDPLKQITEDFLLKLDKLYFNLTEALSVYENALIEGKTALNLEEQRLADQDILNAAAFVTHCTNSMKFAFQTFHFKLSETTNKSRTPRLNTDQLHRRSEKFCSEFFSKLNSSRLKTMKHYAMIIIDNLESLYIAASAQDLPMKTLFDETRNDILGVSISLDTANANYDLLINRLQVFFTRANLHLKKIHIDHEGRIHIAPMEAEDKRLRLLNSSSLFLETVTTLGNHLPINYTAKLTPIIHDVKGYMQKVLALNFTIDADTKAITLLREEIKYQARHWDALINVIKNEYQNNLNPPTNQPVPSTETTPLSTLHRTPGNR